jgi:hypothetical protein
MRFQPSRHSYPSLPPARRAPQVYRARNNSGCGTGCAVRYNPSYDEAYNACVKSYEGSWTSMFGRIGTFGAMDVPPNVRVICSANATAESAKSTASSALSSAASTAKSAYSAYSSGGAPSGGGPSGMGMASLPPADLSLPPAGQDPKKDEAPQGMPSWFWPAIILGGSVATAGGIYFFFGRTKT